MGFKERVEKVDFTLLERPVFRGSYLGRPGFWSRNSLAFSDFSTRSNPGIDWPENWNYLGAHCFPKGLRLPRTIADKLLELLLINPKALSHWLHALAASRQQESLHIKRGSFATLLPT